MKTLLSLVCVPAFLMAQAPAPKPSVSMEVKTVRSGASTSEAKWKESNKVGTMREVTTSLVQRSRSGIQDLEVALLSLSQRPESFEIEWFFFVRDVKDSEILLHCHASQDVLMRPGGIEKIIVSPDRAYSSESRRVQMDKVVSETKVETSVATEHEKAGIKIVGWLVLAKDNGVVFASRASSPMFEAYMTEEGRKGLRTSEETGGGFVK